MSSALRPPNCERCGTTCAKCSKKTANLRQPESGPTSQCLSRCAITKRGTHPPYSPSTRWSTPSIRSRQSARANRKPPLPRTKVRPPMVLADLFQKSSRAPRLAGRGMIKAYQYTLSPLVGFDCRHLPTCSDYADQALDRFGLWAGGWMTLARLLRCQPWGTSGLDFVPDAVSPNARWYLPWRYARWRGTNAPARALDET